MIFDVRNGHRSPGTNGICRCGNVIERRDVKVYCSERCQKQAYRLRHAGIELQVVEGVCPVDGKSFEPVSELPKTCSPECAREQRLDTPYCRFHKATQIPRRKWRRWLAGHLRCQPDLPQLDEVALALAEHDRLNVYVNAAGVVVEVGLPR